METKKTIIINQSGEIVEVISKRSNGFGKAGLALSILGIVFCWLPVFGWLFTPLAFLFSFIGIFRSPRGQAIAGMIISGVSLLLVALCLEISTELLEEMF